MARGKDSGLDYRVSRNAGAIHALLKREKVLGAREMSGLLLTELAYEVSDRRVSDYFALLRDHGYAERLAMLPGRSGRWRVTKKAPPGDWAEVFKPSIKGCAGKSSSAMLRDRDAPVGVGEFTLERLFGLVPHQPPASVGRVYRAPTDYDYEEQMRRQRSAA